jgi:hypothetical protein
MTKNDNDSIYFIINTIYSLYILQFLLFYFILLIYYLLLKTDLSAYHAAETGATGPATTDLTFNENAAIGGSDRDATASAVALVVDVSRTGKSGRGCARIGILN